MRSRLFPPRLREGRNEWTGLILLFACVFMVDLALKPLLHLLVLDEHSLEQARALTAVLLKQLLLLGAALSLATEEIRRELLRGVLRLGRVSLWLRTTLVLV